MFRFSIRELLLVTLVVALVVGWAIDHWRPSNIYRKMDLKNAVMEEGLKLLGYEVKEEWPGVRIDRNNERPWNINTEQRPGEMLIVGGITGGPSE